MYIFSIISLLLYFVSYALLLVSIFSFLFINHSKLFLNCDRIEHITIYLIVAMTGTSIAYVLYCIADAVAYRYRKIRRMYYKCRKRKS